MKYLVRALDTYKLKNIQDNELNKIPEKGYEWEVDQERLDVLLGNNKHKCAFVELVQKETKTVEKATKPKKNVEKRK